MNSTHPRRFGGKVDRAVPVQNSALIVLLFEQKLDPLSVLCGTCYKQKLPVSMSGNCITITFVYFLVAKERKTKYKAINELPTKSEYMTFKISQECVYWCLPLSK